MDDSFSMMMSPAHSAALLEGSKNMKCSDAGNYCSDLQHECVSANK